MRRVRRGEGARAARQVFSRERTALARELGSSGQGVMVVGGWLGGWGRGGTWAHRERRIQVCRQAAALQGLRRLDEARRDAGRPLDDARLLHLGEARSPGEGRVERVGNQLACGGCGRGGERRSCSSGSHEAQVDAAGANVWHPRANVPVRGPSPTAGAPPPCSGSRRAAGARRSRGGARGAR